MIKLRARASVCMCVLVSMCGCLYVRKCVYLCTTNPCRPKGNTICRQPMSILDPTPTKTGQSYASHRTEQESDRDRERVGGDIPASDFPYHSHTYSIFYLMHSLLILIFISVSIFFFTLLGCVFLCHPSPVWRTTATDIARTVDCASLSTSLLDACVCTGVRCWGWLVSAIKWTNEGYKTIRFGFLFGVLCWLLFLFGSLRFHFCSFFFVLRQSILLLYVFPFSCRPLGWSLYLYLFVGSKGMSREVREGGHAKCLCVRWSILFGAAFRHGFGQDLCSVVGCFYLPFGCVCLHGKCPSVHPTVRPTVRPAVRLSRPACRSVLSCVLFM